MRSGLSIHHRATSSVAPISNPYMAFNMFEDDDEDEEEEDEEESGALRSG